MKDRSQIQDMRAAIRGDLERSRARGQSGGLLDAEPEPVLEPQVEPEPPVEPEPEPVPQFEPEPVAESRMPEEAPEAEPESEAEPPAPEEPRPGFFGSLFRRR